jgi:hypothetical protein
LTTEGVKTKMPMTRLTTESPTTGRRQEITTTEHVTREVPTPLETTSEEVTASEHVTMKAFTTTGIAVVNCARTSSLSQTL